MEIRPLTFGRSQFQDESKGQIQLIEHNLEIQTDHINKDRAITILKDNLVGPVWYIPQPLLDTTYSNVSQKFMQEE